MRRVLIIEDDVKISDWLKKYFEKAEYETDLAYDGITGLKKSRDINPDLVILDLNLPEMDGMEVCRTIRKESTIPIIMLTARDSYKDRIEGLTIGADDYVIKPFDPKEVIARADALLRRVHKEVQQQLSAGDISLNVKKELVLVKDQIVDLSHIQFVLLTAFMRHPNQLLTRDQLMELVYQDEFEGFDRSIDNHILKLRKKLNQFGVKPIQTVYGGGYKFIKENN
jgi:DNA-binding response OmpR family regulator